MRRGIAMVASVNKIDQKEQCEHLTGLVKRQKKICKRNVEVSNQTNLDNRCYGNYFRWCYQSRLVQKSLFQSANGSFSTGGKHKQAKRSFEASFYVELSRIVRNSVGKTSPYMSYITSYTAYCSNYITRQRMSLQMELQHGFPRYCFRQDTKPR